jgi:hypothetical protein
MAKPMPVIPGVVRASIRGSLPSGRSWANVVHCRYAGGASNPGPTEITALHAKLARLWNGPAYASGLAWIGMTKNNVTTIDVTYYPLDGMGTSLVLAAAATGALAANLEPPEVAHVLTLRTNTRGRSYRGRIFFGALTTSQLDGNGNLSATPISQLIAQFNGLQADLTSIQWKIVVASYLRSVATDVTNVTMDPQPDVIRRRKR